MSQVIKASVPVIPACSVPGPQESEGRGDGAPTAPPLPQGSQGYLWAFPGTLTSAPLTRGFSQASLSDKALTVQACSKPPARVPASPGLLQ